MTNPEQTDTYTLFYANPGEAARWEVRRVEAIDSDLTRCGWIGVSESVVESRWANRSRAEAEAARLNAEVDR